MLILVRGLSVADYSAYIFISSVGNYLSTLIGSGINLSLVRYSASYTSQHQQEPKILYKLSILFQIVVFFFLSLASFLFNDRVSEFLFGQASVPNGLYFGILFGIGLLIFNYSRSIYQAEERFNRLVVVSWLVQFLVFVLFLIGYLCDFLNIGYVSAIYSLSYLFTGLFILLEKRGFFNWQDFSKELLTYKQLLDEFLKSSGWLIGYFSFLALISRLDVYFLSRFMGEKDIAIYGVALQYYNLGLLVLGSIHWVLLPKFSKVEMQSTAAHQKFLAQWLKLTSLLIIPILIFDLAGKPLFTFINGLRYEAAYPILIVFSVGIYLSLMMSPLTNILISKGDFRFLFMVGGAALILNPIANLVLVPAYGGIGAAIVVVLTHNVLIHIPVLLRGLKVI